MGWNRRSAGPAQIRSGAANVDIGTNGSADTRRHVRIRGRNCVTRASHKPSDPMALSARSGESPLDRDLNAYMAGDGFERDFKPTGKVRGIGSDLHGGKYRSTECAGSDPDSGKPLRIWLAKPDFEAGFHAAAYMGSGVVALPKANVQRLVTRMEGEGVVFEASYVMRKPQRFSGAGYKNFQRDDGGLRQRCDAAMRPRMHGQARIHSSMPRCTRSARRMSLASAT